MDIREEMEGLKNKKGLVLNMYKHSLTILLFCVFLSKYNHVQIRPANQKINENKNLVWKNHGKKDWCKVDNPFK